MRILLIEDDSLIGDGVRAGLGKRGFAVDWLTDGIAAKNVVTLASYDAVVLDLTLPGADGLDVLRQWRTAGSLVPVLVLTARGELDQRVEGLNLGADDYLGKPFALEELAARLRALVRRGHGRGGSVLSHGGVTLDQTTRKVTLNGQDAHLSPKEILLVELFLLNGQNVLSRAVIEENIYPWGEEVSSNAVEVHVHHIRKKLGSGFVKTAHGVGYILGDAP